MALSDFSGLNISVVWGPKTVARTWKERLFSRPWRPWRRFKIVEHPLWGKVKDGNSCFQMGRTLYVSERQFSEIWKMETPKWK